RWLIKPSGKWVNLVFCPIIVNHRLKGFVSDASRFLNQGSFVPVVCPLLYLPLFFCSKPCNHFVSCLREFSCYVSGYFLHSRVIRPSLLLSLSLLVFPFLISQIFLRSRLIFSGKKIS